MNYRLGKGSARTRTICIGKPGVRDKPEFGVDLYAVVPPPKNATMLKASLNSSTDSSTIPVLR